MSQAEAPEYVRYTRLSKGRAGISRQKTATGRYVDKQGGRIIADFSDADQTAYARPGAVKPRRDDFTAMLDMLRARPGLRVVAWHADRLTRNHDDTGHLIRVCGAGGILIETPSGGTYDLSTATGRKRLRDDASAAEYEVDHNRERVLEKKTELRTEGRWLGGHRPFGWDIDYDSPGGLALNTAEAPAVAAAAAHVLAGGSLHAISREWNASELLTSTRRRWTPAEVRRVLLRETNWAPPPAQWPPLVDADTHRAVSGILRDPARKTTRGPEVVHLLSGIARCGMCWEPMICSTARGRLVYRCRNAQTGKEGGAHVARDVASLDAYVTEVIIAWFENNSERFAVAPAASPLAAIDAERETVQLAMKASNDLRRQGLLTTEEFAEERAGHIRKMADLDLRASDARSADRMADMRVRPREAWANRTLDRKRAVVRELCEIVIAPQAKGRPKGWQPGQPYLDTSTVIFGWKR